MEKFTRRFCIIFPIYLLFVKIYQILLPLYVTINHNINKCCVSSGRVVYKNMGNCTYYPVILYYGTAAHSLDNTSGFLQQLLVGNLIIMLCCVRIFHYAFDIYFVLFNRLAFNILINRYASPRLLGTGRTSIGSSQIRFFPKCAKTPLSLFR